MRDAHPLSSPRAARMKSKPLELDSYQNWAVITMSDAFDIFDMSEIKAQRLPFPRKRKGYENVK
mgnify:FL=1